MKKILIVDDEIGSRESLKMVFSRDYQVILADSATVALNVLAEQRMDVVLLDVIMPEKDGLTLLKEAQNLYPDIPFIMISASTALRPVVEAIKAGASDFVAKPFDVTEIRRIVARAIETSVLRRKVELLQSDVAREFPVDGLVGQSDLFKKALDDIERAAKTDATVLICGASGTGKELMARRLHMLSARHEEPFVAVHCAALPESLIESELFGYEKGAFTNAAARHLGRFDLAGSGTLFFDEVSEMSLAIQVKLLRVLQEREYMRIGGTQMIHTEARIIAATTRDLAAEVKARRFRDDLFYRLNVVPIYLPPLRERTDDIPALAHHFLRCFKRTMSVETEDFAPETMPLLRRYAWPGNVRELRNIVERMLVLHGHHRLIGGDALPEEFHAVDPGALEPNHLAPVEAPSGGEPGRTLRETVHAQERELIREALSQANGVQTRAAALLGTTRRILKYRMDKLHIRPDGSLGVCRTLPSAKFTDS
jgi:DNA-binding NtrC family response regulator